MRLKDKVAIVTGGASGFGEGIARRFAGDGARVVIADLNETAARNLASEIGGLAVRADVSKGADVATLAKAATERFGTIDILVNNAGIGHTPRPLDTLAEEDFDRIHGIDSELLEFAVDGDSFDRNALGGRDDFQDPFCKFVG